MQVATQVLRDYLATLPEKPVAPIGVDAWDAILPGGFARASVHELLFDAVSPVSPAMKLGCGVLSKTKRKFVWIDELGTFYPPAALYAGVPLDQLCVIRPKREDVLWTLAECLRCPGVGVVTASVKELTRVEARRLQLSAEKGGGVAILLRQRTRRADLYAAATRWLVSPARGDRLAQRWNVELLHGHGGRLGQSFLLEIRRGLALSLSTRDVVTHPVHPPARLADHASPASRATA